jgi:hypothetical protein
MHEVFGLVCSHSNVYGAVVFTTNSFYHLLVLYYNSMWLSKLINIIMLFYVKINKIGCQFNSKVGHAQ